MAKEYRPSRVHLTFDGNNPQTISPISSEYFIKLVYADIYTTASTIISAIIGSYTIFDGTVGNISPVQLKFGEGQGSCVAGEALVIDASVACTIDIGIINVLK